MQPFLKLKSAAQEVKVELKDILEPLTLEFGDKLYDDEGTKLKAYRLYIGKVPEDSRKEQYYFDLWKEFLVQTYGEEKALEVFQGMAQTIEGLPEISGNKGKPFIEGIKDMLKKNNMRIFEPGTRPEVVEKHDYYPEVAGEEGTGDKEICSFPLSRSYGREEWTVKEDKDIKGGKALRVNVKTPGNKPFDFTTLITSDQFEGRGDGIEGFISRLKKLNSDHTPQEERKEIIQELQIHEMKALNENKAGIPKTRSHKQGQKPRTGSRKGRGKGTPER